MARSAYSILRGICITLMAVLHTWRYRSPRFPQATSSRLHPAPAVSLGDKPFDVLGQQVALDINRISGPLAAQGRHLERVWNQRAGKTAALDAEHGQADTVHRHRSLLHQVARLLGRHFEGKQARIPLRLDGND